MLDLEVWGRVKKTSTKHLSRNFRSFRERSSDNGTLLSGVKLSSLFVGDTELLFDADTGRKRVKYFVKPPIMPLLTNS